MTIFLLLEDEPNDAFFVEREFKDTSAHILLRCVRDGVEAIEYLEGKGKYSDRAEYPVPNVILLDLKMPRVNGFDFLQWLRQSAPEKFRLIPAIVMSASAVESDIARSYALGANSYVIRPVSWSKLRERINALGQYWSRHSATPANC